MSTKRSLSSDSSDSRSVKHAKTDASPTSSAVPLAQLMAKAMRFGVLSFLTTRDATAVLSCCKAFRNDSELARSALLVGSAREYASHFFHKCGLDWFTLDPTRFPLGFEDEAYCRGHKPSKKLRNTSKRPQANAQLVSLVTMFEELILPARPNRWHGVTAWGDNVFAVPAAISLWDHHPNKQSLEAGHEWTREDVRVALNGKFRGFGDEFADDDPKEVYGSDFGAHWENIHLVADGTAACAFCDKWDHFEQRENLLPFPEGPEWEEVNLNEASNVLPRFPELCSVYAQPLKRSLLKFFKFVNRVEFPQTSLDSNGEPWFVESSCHSRVELLAGVSSSGFLCGSFYVRNENM